MYILQAIDVKKKYNNTEVLKGINIDIKEGEIYGILGPNGAGKSTFIKILCGLEKMNSGKIIYEENISNINKYKKYIGLLPQDLSIYTELTAKENISFFCSLYGYKGKKLKSMVDEALYFTKLEDFRNKKSKEFSGGMKRRLNMACSIAHKPKLLIMDEPTVGIDPQSRNHIIESVKKLNKQGTSVIYTSHYMEEVEELCQNISIIDHGQIIAKGDKEYLKHSILNEYVYIITLKNKPYDMISFLSKIDGINKVTINKNEIKCYYSKEKNILQKLINVIYNHGGLIENIENEIPNLETVFLKLTGKKLRD